MSERTCTIEGCGREHYARGWCQNHYMLWRKNGDPLINKRPNLGAGRAIEGGYVILYRPGHPIADSSGWVREHRLVMWEAGLLTDREHVVHHKNGDKRDNRIENLEVMTRSDHNGEHSRQHNGGGTFQAAKTHCPRGHPYNEANTYIDHKGGRLCRACAREKAQERRDRAQREEAVGR